MMHFFKHKDILSHIWSCEWSSDSEFSLAERRSEWFDWRRGSVEGRREVWATRWCLALNQGRWVQATRRKSGWRYWGKSCNMEQRWWFLLCTFYPVRCLCDIYVIFSGSYKDLEFWRRDPEVFREWVWNCKIKVSGRTLGIIIIEKQKEVKRPVQAVESG